MVIAAEPAPPLLEEQLARLFSADAQPSIFWRCTTNPTPIVASRSE
jgi:hypothetical protein